MISFSSRLRNAVAAGIVIVGAAMPLAATHAASAMQQFQGNIVNTSKTAGIKSTGTDVGSVAGSIIGSLLGLLGIVLVVIIIYAGFLWMTAQGDEGKVKQAKTMIQRAIVGMVVIFAAYAIEQATINLISRSGLTGKYQNGAVSDACLLDPKGCE